MKVIKYGQSIKTRETTLVLGGFGMIHNGHKLLIEEAQKLKKPISIMIIENPEYFNNKKPIQPLEDRLQNLANLGVSIAVVVKMDITIASTPGKIFLENIKKSVNAKKTFSGKDFVVGKNKELTAQKIEDNIVVEPLKVNEAKLSTSLLVEDLKSGDVKNIKRNSPFGYTMISKVNTKGILDNKDYVEKSAGIYAIWGEVNDVLYWGYTHIDFNGQEHVYLPQLKVDNKVYKVRIHYQNLIRRIIKSSEDKVFEQDIENTKKFLSA